MWGLLLLLGAVGGRNSSSLASQGLPRAAGLPAAGPVADYQAHGFAVLWLLLLLLLLLWSLIVGATGMVSRQQEIATGAVHLVRQDGLPVPGIFFGCGVLLRSSHHFLLHIGDGHSERGMDSGGGAASIRDRVLRSVDVRKIHR